MTPFYSDDWLTILQGDVREVLPTLPADSVDCIVTSPPYWGLRDYGTASWSGGTEGHEHAGQELRTADTGGPKQQTKRGSIGVRSGDCECGATRSDGQIGLERTPEEYVANLVGVFRELRRVLKPSGTAWCNLGDSFLPGKQLAGIPWRVAFALQADGWYLRSDIIWAKPNPMPESVTDRPTKAHEYLFLLTKSVRYYFDSDAVREVGSVDSHGGGVVGVGQKKAYTGNGHSGLHAAEPAGAAGRNLRSVWTIATRPYPGAHFAVFPPELPERCIKAGSPELGTILDPFAGSGTTGMVANRLSRRAILIDLNGDYLKQQLQRNAQTPLGLGAA